MTLCPRTPPGVLLLDRLARFNPEPAELRVGGVAFDARVHAVVLVHRRRQPEAERGLLGVSHADRRADPPRLDAQLAGEHAARLRIDPERAVRRGAFG